MELVTRTPGRASSRSMLVACLQLVFLSSLMIRVTNSHRINEMMELHGSMARYQELIIHPSGSKRDLLQEDNESNNEQIEGRQQELTEPEKYVEEFHEQREVVVHSDTEVPVVEGDESEEQNSQQEPQEESEVRTVQEQEEKEEKEEETREENTVTESQETEEVKEVKEGQETEGVKESNNDNEKQEDTVDEKEKEAEKELEPIVVPEPHYLLGPVIKDWDEQRSQWLEENPEMKSLPDGKPRVLIVTGSQPSPCSCPIGDNFHVRSLKLKIDYARMHNYEIFYNIVHLDPLFDRYWVKLPTIRKLMLTHPEIEWFFWVDSDATFTDMLFEAPFKDYDGFNMVMWGWRDGLLKQKSWVAYNAGVFLIRNCQWTLDLIDKWSPYGPKGPLRQSLGKQLSAHLTSRAPEEECDDQSSLAYLIIKDEEVRNKVKLIEMYEYVMSGYWVEVGETFEECMEKYHPKLGDERWPWITHLVGCSPCSCGSNPGYGFEKCMSVFEKAYNFADNQVLAYMGFQHESLLSPNLTRIRDDTDRPIEALSVSPWAERIAQVAERGERASMSA